MEIDRDSILFWFAAIQSLTALATFCRLDIVALGGWLKGAQRAAGQRAALTTRQRVILALCVGSLLTSMYGFWARPPQLINCLKEFGIAQPGMLRGLVNGKCFSGRASKFNTAVVAFHASGVKDLTDDLVTARTGPHDIVDGDIFVQLEATQQFKDEVNAGARGTVYMLLLVPKSLSMNQFSTMREAKRLGVEIVESRMGPP